MGERRLVTMVMVNVVVVVVMATLVTGLDTVPMESTDAIEHVSSQHLTMLKRSVEEIKRSWAKTSTSHHVFKRSTDSQADDLLLNSLASYCNNFLSDPKIARHVQQVADRQPLSKRDITLFTRFKSSGKTPSMEPAVFPVKVWAQRENNKVWIIFEIAQSETAIVSRIDPFNFQKSIIEMPEGAVCQKIVSKVRFGIDSSITGCKTGEYSSTWKDTKAIFQMSPIEDSHYTITVYVDLCKYDKTFDSRYHRPFPMLTQIVSYPSFRIVPDPGHFVLIENGRDMTLNVELKYSYGFQFSMDLVLWDWSTKRTIHSKAWLSKHSPYSVDQIDYDNEAIMTARVLNHSDSTLTLSITFNAIGSGNRSGQFHFIYTSLYLGSYPYKSQVVSKADLERMVEIRLKDRPQSLPEDLVYLSPRKRIMCDKDGLRDQKKDLGFGKNCTVSCHAFGQEVTSIYITKLQPSLLPVRLTSYINQNRAVARMDVGPSSGDIEGGYQCVAVDKRGQTTTQDLNLYTSLFTKINHFSLSNEHEDTPLITCSVTGDKILDLSISVSVNGGNETRLDTEEKYEKNITRDGDQTKITLAVPWTDLKVPKDTLTCSVKGNRGDDEMTTNLLYYEDNRRGIYALVERDEFNVTQNEDRTTSYTCFASGEQPIKMDMHFRDYWEDDIIEIPTQYPVNKTTKTFEDRVSMTLTVPLMFTRHHNSLEIRCEASNKFNTHFSDFYAA